MTALVERAMAEVEKLSAEDQDAIASRVLAEIEDERQWHVRFSAISDEQWERMAAEARNDAAHRGTWPLEAFFPPDALP